MIRFKINLIDSDRFFNDFDYKFFDYDKKKITKWIKMSPKSIILSKKKEKIEKNENSSLNYLGFDSFFSI